MIFEEIQLFGAPVARVAIHETHALREQYLPEILRRYRDNAYPIPPQFESDRIHTSFGVPNEGQVIHPIPAAYDRLIRQFVTAPHFHVRIWHSVYGSGHEFQERRHNLPGHFSFLHFLSFDSSQHRRPIFYAPSGVTRAHCHMDGVSPELWSEEAKIEFYEGDSLVFPSYLEHCILAGDYQKPMVIVSINVEVAGYDPKDASRGYVYGS